MQDCTIMIEFWGGEEKVLLFRDRYTNGNLAVVAVEAETGDTVGGITINTDTRLPENMACLDVNRFPELFHVLLRKGIAVSSGRKISREVYANTYQTYPVAVFRLEKIPDIKNREIVKS